MKLSTVIEYFDFRQVDSSKLNDVSHTTKNIFISGFFLVKYSVSTFVLRNTWKNFCVLFECNCRFLH